MKNKEETVNATLFQFIGNINTEEAVHDILVQSIDNINTEEEVYYVFSLIHRQHKYRESS